MPVVVKVAHDDDDGCGRRCCAYDNDAPEGSAAALLMMKMKMNKKIKMEVRLT